MTPAETSNIASLRFFKIGERLVVKVRYIHWEAHTYTGSMVE